MNVALLEYELNLNNLNKRDFAKKINMSESALYRKLRGKTQFTLEDIKHIAKLLNLSLDKVIRIFFSDTIFFTEQVS